MVSMYHLVDIITRSLQINEKEQKAKVIGER